MMPLWRKLRPALLAGAFAVYVLLSYLASSTNHPPLLAVIVGSLPLAAGIVAACWQSPFRWPAMLACLAAGIAIALNIDRLIGHAAWLYFIQHLGAMLSLGVLFGGTLRSHEGALCSRIAKLAIAEELDARYLHYTWRVTLVWTLYFAVSAIVSVALFCLAPLAAWAFFATVLTPISLGIMFGGEFLIRLRTLPDRPHFSIAQTIRSYRQYMQQRKSSAATPISQHIE
ncbi:hypothetical protein [Paludibacterium purpuratum]|uniref:Putative membrane protein n=1 Tax=Paludibacterium purpuratum TaxID=1144873 RepID=A0A4R7B238_9NEIS|nr:hypothetical protein [Paludibacterium purpuratum]TDR77789.1 putative membrane protein [Paludibacterium purpuratum]